MAHLVTHNATRQARPDDRHRLIVVSLSADSSTQLVLTVAEATALADQLDTALADAHARPTGREARHG